MMSFRIAMLPVLGLLLALPMALHAQDEPRAMDYGSGLLDRVNNMKSDTQAGEMIDLLQTVPQGDSLFERALLRRTDMEVGRDSFANGLAAAELGIRQQGKFIAYFHYEKIVALSGLKQYARAEAYADSCITLFPASFSFPDMKARVVNESGDHARALTLFKANVKRFPMCADAHSALGNLARQEGKTAQAALCYSMALCLRFGGDSDTRNLNILDQLLAGTLDNTPVGLDLGKDDDFSDIDLLLQNKVAMVKGYKVKPDLPYPMCRQSHLLFTYLTKNSTGTGFWSTYYVPLFKQMMTDNYFEGFVYNALYNADNAKVKGIAVKKKKVVDAFRTNYWAYIQSVRQVYPDSAGGAPVKHWYGNNGNISGIGEGNAVTGIYTGPWVHYFENGALYSRGVVGDDGKRTGHWLEYYDNGAVKRSFNYKEGNEDGTYLAYHRTGALDDSTAVVDGNANGPYHHHASSGTLVAEKVFLDGKFTGPAKSRFACNTVEDDYALVDNKANGPAINYYPDGVKQYAGSYAMGKRTGLHTTWFHNGQKESEYTYVDGETSGPFRWWWPNGTLKETGTRLNDKITGVDSTWEENGMLGSVGEYDNKGRSTGIYRNYDHGRAYMELEYMHDLLIRYRYLDPTGKVIGEGQRKQGKFQFVAYDPQGNKSSAGSYLDEGNKDGEWTGYFPDGTVKYVDNFQKGVKQGTERIYYTNGKLKEDNDFAQGDRTGTYKKLYLNGKPQYIGWMVKGNINGTYRHYLPNGILVEDEYYVDGDRNGWQDYFDNNGKPTRSELAVDGSTREKIVYDDSGAVRQHFVVPPGPYVLHDLFPNGTPRNSIEMMNGTFHGNAKWYYPNGATASEGSYVNGKKNGTWTWYYTNGQKHFEEQFIMGDQEGLELTWFRDGKLFGEENYAGGDKNGTYKTYWPNGKLRYERNRLNGMEQGADKNYASDGTPQLVRYYDQDRLIGYANPKADGSFGDTIAVGAGVVEVKGLYPDGSPSRTLHYRNGELNGAYLTYHPNGKPEEVEELEADKGGGADKEYYPNGKLRVVVNFENGLRHGEYAEYAENGKLLEQGVYNYGDLEGEYKVWDATGKLLATYTYADGAMISMK